MKSFQVCTNTNKCYCDLGWAGTDCTTTVIITTTISSYVAVTMTQDEASGKKETQYGKTFSPNPSNIIKLEVLIKPKKN